MLSFVLHQGTEPLVLDQPEDDLDTEWITQLVIRQLRTSRWTRQLVIVTHNANIPVNADAERVIVLENLGGGVRVRTSELGDGTVVVHCGPLENEVVRADIQQIMEGACVPRDQCRSRAVDNQRTTLVRLGAGTANRPCRRESLVSARDCCYRGWRRPCRYPSRSARSASSRAVSSWSMRAAHTRAPSSVTPVRTLHPRADAALRAAFRQSETESTLDVLAIT